MYFPLCCLILDYVDVVKTSVEINQNNIVNSNDFWVKKSEHYWKL